MPAKTLNLRTCSEIAKAISLKLQTTCSHTTVYRAIRRMKMSPHAKTPGGYELFTDAQAARIEKNLPAITSRTSAEASRNPAEARPPQAKTEQPAR